MKKLLLSLLLVYPAFGFAGGEKMSGEWLNEEGGKIHLKNGDYCKITKITDEYAKVGNWVIPGLLYREYTLQPYETADGYIALNNNPSKSTLRLSPAAKVGIGAAGIAAIYIGATKYFGAESNTTKFLSMQKDNFVNGLSAVFGRISNAVSPLLTSAGETVSSTVSKVGEVASSGVETVSKKVGSLFETKK